MQKILQKLGKDVLSPDEFLQGFYSLLGKLMRLVLKSYAQVI